MDLYTGTSGFSYKEWKGPFYPEDLAASKMLRWYADRLPVVEINNTFYRLPKKELLARWAAEVPEQFRFAVKASQRITHFARLKLESATEPTKYLLETVGAMGDRLGPLLFQLPPNMKKDADRLAAFLELLPREREVTFEFRNVAWLEDDVLELLRSRGIALCAADTGEEELLKVVPTTSWGYLRLRREDYTDEAIAAWVKRIREQPWERVYVFFKHEDSGTAPRFALKMRELWDTIG